MAASVPASSTSRCHTKRTRPGPTAYVRTPCSMRAATNAGCPPAERTDVEHDDVRLDGRGVNRRRSRLGTRRGEARSPGVVVVETIEVVVQGVDAGRRQDADLPHPRPVPLAPDPGLRHVLRRAHEHRAHRGTEPLGQAHADRVELLAVCRERHPGRDVGVPQPRPVEVHRHPEGLGGCPHLTDGLDRLHRAATEVVGVLQHDERGLDLVGPDPGRDERHRPAGRAARARWARTGS
jgi:hypothetical protein